MALAAAADADAMGTEAHGAEGPCRVCTVGPLIHNPQALDMLRARGIAALEAASPEELPGDLRDTVCVIRAHGITPRLEAALAARGARIVDATCPRVKASQERARSLAEGGYRLFLAGEKRHGEIIGIQGYAPDCVIVADAGEAVEAARLCRDRAGEAGKTALIGQTTISPEEYRAIGEAIGRFFPDLEVLDTICGATRERQDALKELCGWADALIVAGGRESANTRRLLAIARARGKPAWLAETAAALPPEIASYPVVGLSAGASTPEEVIDGIEEALRLNSWAE
jgi:4-hydroxy-3-methylbut-2-enyl diphosphate reductase